MFAFSLGEGQAKGIPGCRQNETKVRARRSPAGQPSKRFSRRVSSSWLRNAPWERFRKACTLLGRIAQVAGTDIMDHPFCPQSSQRDRWVDARDQHQVQRRRPVACQLAEQLVHRLAMNGVVVIQDKDKFSGKIIELIAECGMEDGPWGRALGTHQGEGLLTGIRKNRAQCSDEITQKEAEVAVIFIQRKPGGRQGSHALQPVADQCAFSKTCRSADQGKGVIQALAESSTRRGRMTRSCGRRDRCSLV